MRLSAIRAHNVGPVRAAVLSIPAEARVVVIAGPNGSGKTALIEGVRLVLDGALPRELRYKKDLPELITEGEKDGWMGVECVRDGRTSEYKVSLKTGNAAGSSAPELGNAGYVLAPQAFLALEPAQRRKVLFERTGKRLRAADIAAQLVADGHAEARVHRLETALGAGFDNAARTAKELASEARGGWQAITGETYGSAKAADWRAIAPTTWDDPKEKRKELAAAQERVNITTRKLRSLEDDERRHQESVTVATDAGALPELEAHQRTLAERIAEKEKAVDTARAQAQPKRGGWTCACPACGVLLRAPETGVLEEEKTPAKASAAAANAALEAASAGLQGLRDEHRACTRKVEHARASKLMLERLPERPAPEELASAREDSRVALDSMRILEDDVRQAEYAEEQAATAAARTDKAAQLHADVVAFNALAEAITALPAKYLSEVLDTVNAALAVASSGYERMVTLGDDMELRYGTIRYALLSRSHKLRAALALGVALGQKDGGVVLVDEFDLVEPAARVPILRALAAQDRVQVILGATLKGAMKVPPESGINAHWLGPKE